MQPYFNQMTQNGYDQITAEIAQLMAAKPERIKILQAARALGDLSENAEYSSAKRDLRHLESRLRYLNKQLQYAQILAPKTDGTADIGNTVVVEFLDDHEQVTYQLVGKEEVDVNAGKISVASPLGQALRGKKAPSTVTVSAPATTYQVKILTIRV
ncbi:transcription elongation factor GreA [Loigolactobacillus binensis]|uniref:Transcription elongation factor GreA n=1 Tax=Loigolactobacillus binensis TaxID=2559922 RepID=A0ABW3ECV8_9LACO|nr:transcription elongation factor GreA [Loigolactobacillus binensis]